MGEKNDTLDQADALMTGKEILVVTERLHRMLRSKADEAKAEHEKKPKDEKLLDEYLERAKDMYVFARIVDSCVTLGKKVAMLEEMVAMLEQEVGVVDGISDVLYPKKTGKREPN
jgi:hypothetical protein